MSLPAGAWAQIIRAGLDAKTRQDHLSYLRLVASGHAENVAVWKVYFPHMSFSAFTAMQKQYEKAWQNGPPAGTVTDE